jgi:hypothetical protein
LDSNSVELIDFSKEELLEVVLKLKNKRKNKDWVKVEEGYDEMCKVLKAQKRTADPPRTFLKVDFFCEWL